MTNRETILNKALELGEGVLRLFPNWVPREFCIPGRRLKLHPDDDYSFGTHRGGIDERWFCSTTKADNGPLTLENENQVNKLLLADAINIRGNDIIGKNIMEKYEGWPMYSKFFDNLEPLPLHLHQDDEKADLVGCKGKPEGYYFPKQLNNHPAYFPHTYFGLNPGTTREDVKKCLDLWNKQDNGILYLSKAYNLKLGTGWDVPPGVLHAPGSLLTYEPQYASDVFSMFQNITWNKYVPRDLLIKDVPEERRMDLDFIVDLIDWDLNTDPDFYKNRFLEPKPVKPIKEMKEEGYEEYLVVYNSDAYSAKELTIFPGKSITIKESSAYGIIVIQGHGRFGVLDIESPSMIRFGEMTRDELFITAEAARRGIEIKNNSKVENLVILKHLGPEK